MIIFKKNFVKIQHIVHGLIINVKHFNVRQELHKNNVVIIILKEDVDGNSIQKLV